MKIEILCNGCDDCEVLKGKVCQAVSDLNLDADVRSDHDPRRHVSGLDCAGELRLRVNGLTVTTKSDCSVRDLMLLLNKELHLYQ
jgi:hypothetical protein